MTPTPAFFWELLLRGLACGALGATAFGLLRAPKGPSRIAGILFCLTSIAYTLNGSEGVRMQLEALYWPSLLFSLCGAGTFWLFVRTLFEDQPITPLNLAPTAATVVIGVVAVSFPDIRQSAFLLHHVVQSVICFHALYMVARGWRDDLVEARRRLRGPFFVAVGIYVLGVTVVESSRSLGLTPPLGPLAGATSLAVLCLAGAFVLLEARAFLFGATAATVAATPAPNAGDRLLVTQLNQLMDGEIWRREGLTIGALASDMKIPEHQLRRLINDELGARNFAAFVNTRRIAAAKRLLADPTKARTPVSAIAFDLGFASLGPFNRAFKEDTGQTPTEWRRRELGEGSPIPENPV